MIYAPSHDSVFWGKEPEQQDMLVRMDSIEVKYNMLENKWIISMFVLAIHTKV